MTPIDKMSVEQLQAARDAHPELDKLYSAYEALLDTPEATGYQAWTLAQKTLTLSFELAVELVSVNAALRREVDRRHYRPDGRAKTPEQLDELVAQALREAAAG
jgi:hypothetical protein